MFNPAHPGELIRETIDGIAEETGKKLTVEEVTQGSILPVLFFGELKLVEAFKYRHLHFVIVDGIAYKSDVISTLQVR